MTFEFFRQHYGTAFYSFINTELGRALISVLEKNDPATRVVSLPPETQTANSTLFLGQTTGWRDCVLCIGNQLIVKEDGPQEVEANYEPEFAGDGMGGALPEDPSSAPPPPPLPTTTTKTTKAKSKSKKRTTK